MYTLQIILHRLLCIDRSCLIASEPPNGRVKSQSWRSSLDKEIEVIEPVGASKLGNSSNTCTQKTSLSRSQQIGRRVVDPPILLVTRSKAVVDDFILREQR